MANMSYCRFENTYRDLRDCYEHMTDANLSREEKQARQAMIELFAQILEECTNVELEYEGEIEITEYDDEETEE